MLFFLPVDPPRDFVLPQLCDLGHWEDAADGHTSTPWASGAFREVYSYCAFIFFLKSIFIDFREEGGGTLHQLQGREPGAVSRGVTHLTSPRRPGCRGPAVKALPVGAHRGGEQLFLAGLELGIHKAARSTEQWHVSVTGAPCCPRPQLLPRPPSHPIGQRG